MSIKSFAKKKFAKFKKEREQEKAYQKELKETEKQAMREARLSQVQELAQQKEAVRKEALLRAHREKLKQKYGPKPKVKQPLINRQEISAGLNGGFYQRMNQPSPQLRPVKKTRVKKTKQKKKKQKQVYKPRGIMESTGIAEPSEKWFF